MSTAPANSNNKSTIERYGRVAPPLIFNIQRYSTHDGPGIRTVVFLKGCTLQCAWCQNPESRSRKLDLLFDPQHCIAGCSLCAEVAPDVMDASSGRLVLDRSRLDEAAIHNLARVCPTGALTACGELLGVDEVFETVLKDEAYYARSGGGLTLSGGEPLIHPEYCRTLLRMAKEHNLHTAIETSLQVPWRYIEDCLPFTDLVLADVKHVNPDSFQQGTKGSCDTSVENFARLAASDVNIVARIPLIPNFNANHEFIRKILLFIASFEKKIDVHVLPYHVFGRKKYDLLDMKYSCGEHSLKDEDLLTFAREYARECGLNLTVGG